MTVMMEMVTRAYKIAEMELRKDSTEDGSENNVLTGYVAEFEKFSHELNDFFSGKFKEKIRKGAFENSIRSKVIKALWNHDDNKVLGSTKSKTLNLWEDERGLKFELILPNSSWGKDALESVRRGDVDGMSFGFIPTVTEWDDVNPNETIRTLVEVDLIEVSPVAFPAYPQTSVSARNLKSLEEDYKKHKEKSFQIEKMSLEKRKLNLLKEEC